MPACAVISCKQNSSTKKKPGVTYHRFPRNRHIAAKWIKAAGLPPKTLTQNLRICSQHFNETDMKLHAKKRYIAETAMPLLDLPRQEHVSALRNKENVVLMPEYTGIKQEIIRRPPTTTENTEIVPPLTWIKNTKLKPIIIEVKPEKTVTLNFHSEVNSGGHDKMDVVTDSTISEKADKNDESPFEPESSSNIQNASQSPEPSCVFPANLSLIKAFHSYSHDPDYQNKTLTKLKASNEILKKKLHAERKTSERRKKTILSLKATVSELKRQASLKADPFTVLNNTLQGGVALELTKRMVQNSNGSLTKEAYPVELKDFAMKLQFYSGRAYDYVREVFDFALPCPSSVRAWLASARSNSSESLKAIEEITEGLDGTNEGSFPS